MGVLRVGEGVTNTERVMRTEKAILGLEKVLIDIANVKISTPMSGSSFQQFSPSGTFLKTFEAEWIMAHPDGWWPNSYDEERAQLELEAEHEQMRKWCEEVSE